MADEPKSKRRLEIAHVLFIDIVGYSKLRTTEQSAQIQKLREDRARQPSSIEPPKPRGSYCVYQRATVARLSFAIWKRLSFAPSKLPKHCGTIQIFASAWAFTVGRLMKSPT